MKAEILAAGDSNPARVAAACAGPVPGGLPFFYQKHMTHHLVPGIPLDFMDHCRNVLLIRHPARVIASYVAKRENPTLLDLGFVQQGAIFDRVADRQGTAPVVIDSADIRANPQESLKKLCGALGIPFSPSMLAWSAGPKPYDGAWAPHWYGAVHRSTGFDSAEAPPPALPVDSRPLLDQALPIYDRLSAYKI
jgi:hypothetical protein